MTELKERRNPAPNGMKVKNRRPFFKATMENSRIATKENSHKRESSLNRYSELADEFVAMHL
jgi:hypothetical protein